MTVRNLGAYLRFLGLSTDLKPTWEDMDTQWTGSEFLETDTGNKYYWDGSQWNIVSAPATQLTQYAVRVENVSASPVKVTYVGEALPGSGNGDAVWRIKQITETDHMGLDPDIEILWCNGTNAFTNVWNGHAGWSYS